MSIGEGPHPVWSDFVGLLIAAFTLASYFGVGWMVLFVIQLVFDIVVLFTPQMFGVVSSLLAIVGEAC